MLAKSDILDHLTTAVIALDAELRVRYVNPAGQSLLGTSDLRSAAELGQYWAEVHGALRAGFERFTPADWSQRHTAMSDADFAANPLRNRAAVVLNRAAHVAFRFR